MSQSTQGGSVLVIDDDLSVVQTLVDLLHSRSYKVTTGSSAAEAIQAVEKGHHGAILLDLNLPDQQGLSIFEELQGLNPANRIIIVTGAVGDDVVVSATRAGAFDFVTKGGDDFAERVLTSTRNAFAAIESEQTIADLSKSSTGGPRTIRIVSAAPSMKPVLAGIQELARSRVSVLIQGASGTGKEVVARSIHARGPRSSERFVVVNCAGIPDTLLESELLGYERGAFTGAVARKIGKFELANRGTIFLDEIGEMSLPLQAKILRVVQDGRFERLGGTREVSVDVRVLSATNRNLSELVAEQRFREDLYYRLAVFTLNVPDLAARKDDIEPLARDFLREASNAENKRVPDIANVVLGLFRKHPWPGNVRQLHNVMSHAAVVCKGEQVTIAHLPQSFVDVLAEPHLPEVAPPGRNGRGWPQPTPEPAAVGGDASAPTQLIGLPASGSVEERLDRALADAFPEADMLPNMAQLKDAGLRLSLDRLGGNRRQAALCLGIGRATVHRMLNASRVSEEAPNQ